MAEYFFRIHDFADHLDLDAEAFAEEYATGFIVYDGTHLRDDGETTNTGVLEVSEIRAMLASKSEYARKYVGKSLVFPVKHGGRSITTQFISIGRTQNNDIVLKDRSVSGFHAMVTEGADGVRRIQDGGSTNGTFVDGQPAPGRDAREGIALENGAELKFGALEMEYYDADEFREVVRQVTGRT